MFKIVPARAAARDQVQRRLRFAEAVVHATERTSHRVGPVSQQEREDLDLRGVKGGDHQGCPTSVFSRIDSGAEVDQQGGGFRQSAPSGPVERGHFPSIPRVQEGRPFLEHSLKPIHQTKPRGGEKIDARSSIDQKAGRLQVSIEDRIVDRCVAVDACGINVGPVIEERFDMIGQQKGRRQVEWRASSVVARVDVRSVIYQVSDVMDATSDTGQMQRRESVGVARVDIGPALEQGIEHGKAAGLTNSEMDRPSAAIRLDGLDQVGSDIEQREAPAHVAFINGLEETTNE